MTETVKIRRKIEEILARVFASGYVTNAYPISAIIVAGIGAGKTMILKRYMKSKGIAFISDVTAYGIVNTLYKDIREKKIKHIIIPDLTTPLAKQQSTRNTFIAFMNSLIEEGVFKISTYAITIEEEIKCGLVTSIPREDFMSGYRKESWFKIGFMSRMIPISYSYSQNDIIKITEKLYKKLVEKEVEELKLKERSVSIDENLAIQLVPYSMQLASSLKHVYPFRQQKQLIILAMSNALYNDRDKVTQEDIDWVKNAMKYINLDYNPL